MTDEHTARVIRDLHEAVRRAQAAGDHEDARRKLRAIQVLDPDDELAESLLDGSARHCQMTLLFCDLVGSTALAERLDLEDMSEVLRAYRRACAAVVERYEGFIEERQGDGLLVRFGPPRVHEDDPRRAVLTGLGIVEAVRERAVDFERRHGIELAVRVSVHTGKALLDAGDIVGTLPNEAARLQALARPGTVLISDTTWPLVRAHFEAEAHGPATLRGVSRSIETYTVLRERSSTRAGTVTRFTPFVGREAERAAIAALWEQAVAGESPAGALVTGGPGIGKSRLIAEAASVLGGGFWLCQCSGYHTTTSLYAFRRLLAELCGVGDDDAPAERLEKLRAAAGRSPGDLPLLAAALSVPLELIRPPTVEASMLRMLALQAAAGILLARLPRPAMLVVEDLQWADESTLELVSALLASEHRGLVIVLTARDGFAPRWPPELTVPLALGPLSGGERYAMAREIPESSSLAEDELRRLVARSDGIPLYLEELAHGADALAWDPQRPSAMRLPGAGIPAALRDPLLARLSTPGVDVELVQIAATIGRDVDSGLLQRAAGLTDEAFQAKVANLLALGLVDRAGDHTIRFRHELIRAVAYDTQRRSARRSRHSRIADLLPVTAVDVADAGEAAFHLECAERFPEAIDAHVSAAGIGQTLGAHKEATQQLTHALELMEHLPDDVSTHTRELTVRQLRGFSAVMSGGYSAPECKEDYARCVVLCETLGLGPELMPFVLANWSYYASCDLGEAEHVREAAERLVETGRLDIPLRDISRGVTGFFTGRFEASRDHLLAFLDHPWSATEGGPPKGWRQPHDPYVAVCAHLAAALWIAGEPGEGHEVAERGLQRAAGLPFPYGPFSDAYVRSQLAIMRRLDGDLDGAAEEGRAMAEIGERHGFPMYVIAGLIQQGLSRVHAGDLEALAGVEAGVFQWCELLAVEVWCPYFLTELAAAQAAAGRRAEAFASLERAQAYARSTGAVFYTAELLRVRGQLRREDGDPRGLDDVREAVETARRQGAVAFVARAEASLQAAHALPAS